MQVYEMIIFHQKSICVVSQVEVDTFFLVCFWNVLVAQIFST